MNKASGVPLDDEGVLKALIDTMPVGILISSPEGKVLSANRRFLEIAGGYSLEEMTAIPVVDLYVHPEDRELVLAELKRGGQVRDFEVEVNIKGGRTLWITISSTVHTSAAGTTILVSAIQDISGRKRSEQALRDNEAKYRFLTEHINDLIWTLDLNLKTTYVTPSVEKMLGFTVAERTAQSASAQLTPESLELVTSRLAEELAHDDEPGVDPNRSFFLELEYYHKDGSVVCLETIVSAIRDESGAPVGIYGVSRDITERKKTEQALQASEERYRNLFESSVDGIVVIGMEGRIEQANQAYLDMLGYTLEELRALPYVEHTPERWHTMELEMLRDQLVPRGYSDEYEKEIVRKDGTLVPVSVRRWLIRDEGGEPAGMWSIARDITERTRYEDELKRMNAELKGFAHTVSHDLKGPLASLMGANKTLQLLLRDPDVMDFRNDIIEMTEIIDKSIGRAEKLISDVLSLAETAQVPSEVAQVDVAEMVRKMLTDSSAEIQAKGIDVRVGEDLGSVLANPTHLYQVFSNLIGNCVKHNNSEAPVIEVVSLGRQEGEHRFLVRDNGSGIAEADLERIFIPFFKGKPGSTGIGLSTVEKILEVYGGGIRAYNDAGACFEFTIRDYY